MTRLPALSDRSQGTRIVITDSGLGGLLIAASLERRLRESAGPGAFELVYVNAWPDGRFGYNDLPDLAARAEVFDRALAAMSALRPDLILIACNTLSVVYRSTAFSRAPSVPVAGILEEGVELFFEALNGDEEAVLALFGTRTTIGSGEHVRRLRARGIDPDRIAAEACHGVAAAIDKDPDSEAVAGLIDECVLRLLARMPAAPKIYAGLACTHYAYVAEVFRAVLARHAGAAVEVLDPGERLVDGLTRELAARGPGAAPRDVRVEVISKVALAGAQRSAVAWRLETLSPATARALLGYRHVPDLF